MRHRFFRSLGIAWGYVCAWLFGLPLGALLGVLCLAGAVRIRGYARACRAIGKGNIILASNHPSLLETFLIPITFTLRGLFNSRYFLWSFPDKSLFGEHKLIYFLWRCIRIDRDTGSRARQHNSTALLMACKVLKSGYGIVVHPEGGRTWKGDPLLENGGRRMRRVSGTAAKLAHLSGGSIMPVWVSMPDGMCRDLPGFRELFARLVQPRHWPITISYGETYRPQSPFNSRAERERLQHEIFHAMA
jgi:1-acyl-sn-glycerol-3-phosphate acyltransferase